MNSGQAQQKNGSKANTKCGQYELLVRIGRGGMASVFLARGPGGRPAAVKVMHKEFAFQREFVNMLIDEARLASRIQHPNVVSTLEVGRDREQPYLVMEYVEGVALDRLLHRSKDERPADLIVQVAIDALRGLHAAHNLRDEAGAPLGLVHRDVTPGNIMVGVDGIGRITDFGVAKARARITRTLPGTVKGKAGYVAPEVVLGRAIDGRADVFSMGVLLWNALTGETLFDTDDMASTLTALMKKDVLPPSGVGLCPPAIFDASVLGALNRTADNRHANAAEMADALGDALEFLAGDVERDRIGHWVTDAYGPQLKRRRELSAGVSEVSPSNEIPRESNSEAPSQSGLRRHEAVTAKAPRIYEVLAKQSRGEKTDVDDVTRPFVKERGAPSPPSLHQGQLRERVEPETPEVLIQMPSAVPPPRRGEPDAPTVRPGARPSLAAPVMASDRRVDWVRMVALALMIFTLCAVGAYALMQLFL